MRKVGYLFAVVLGLGVWQTASAADMPVKAAPIAVPFSWTGCYIGAQAGYKFGNTTPFDPNVGGGDWSRNINFTGFIGGGTVGCNYQINAWVIGAEGDWSWGSVKGSSTDLFNPAFFNVEVKERSLGTLRARVGYTWNQTLLYVTGGGAWSNVRFSFPCIAVCQDFTASKTVSGYTIGAGLEYGFNRHWSVKGEWLYVDFGTPQFIATNVVTGVATDPANVRLRQNLLRAGVNYRF
jgi:outer membrane immunogenic protein